MKFAATLAACALALAISSVTHAEDVLPEVLIQAAQSSVPGRAIDIRGLLPGMTPKEARPILAEMLDAEPTESLERTALYESGLTIRGTPFTKWLSGKVGSETVDVMFSGVSSSNQAVLVTRQADYKRGDEAPIFDAFVTSLVEKYGEPTFRKDGYQGARMIWTYKDGKPAACSLESSSDLPQCLKPTDAFDVLSQTTQYFDVIVYAAIGKGSRDDRRVGQFELSATDLSIKAAADEADEAGLRPALDAALAKAVLNAPKPVL